MDVWIARVVRRGGPGVRLMAAAVRAGFPSPADDYSEERVDLNDLLVANPAATFLVRVDGWSMLGKGLSHGDVAVVDRSLSPGNGDVVVVDVDGDRSFKVYEVVGGRVTLSFANPDFGTFELGEGAEVEVWGVVAASVNPHRRGRSASGPDARSASSARPRAPSRADRTAAPTPGRQGARDARSPGGAAPKAATARAAASRIPPTETRSPDPGLPAAPAALSRGSRRVAPDAPLLAGLDGFGGEPGESSPPSGRPRGRGRS